MRDLGKIVVTRDIKEAMDNSHEFNLCLQLAMDKFSKNDWGKTCQEDAMLNDMSLEHNERILAAYDSPMKEDIWLTTEFYPRYAYEDAFGTLPKNVQGEYFPVTTVLFPHDY